MKWTMSQLNSLDQATFVRALGEVFEHSPWVAERTWAKHPFASLAELHQTMMSSVREASSGEVLALLRAHPDLATRMTVTAFSQNEQKEAGLDSLTEEEAEQFASLNQAYVQKFGFPFILAVRGKTKFEILEAMKRRIPNTEPEELAEALVQIGRIAAFRLKDLIQDDIQDDI